MKILWIAAASVSVVAHVAFAAWVDTREPAPLVKRAPTVMRFVPPKPKPKPKLVEPPPPPPVVTKPRVVRAAVKRPMPTPVTPAPKSGIDPDASGPGDFAVDAGPAITGALGGEVDHAPPPPPPPAPPAPHGKRFVPEFKVTRLPTAKTPIHPELPVALRNAQRELHVTVEVEIDEAGHVVHAHVLGHAEPGLDAAVIAAVEHTEFEPALVGTQPVAVRYHIPFTFRVHG